MLPQYKSYQHHLLSPEDARQRASTSTSTASAGTSTSTPRPNQTAGTGQGEGTTTPDDRRSGTPGLGHGHEHEDGTEASSSPQTPTSKHFWGGHHGGHHHHRSRHHTSYLKKRVTEVEPRKTPGIPEMDAMAVIEAIFNPRPGTENTPFTYIPDDPVAEQEELRGEAEHLEAQSHPQSQVQQNDGNELVVGKRIGWRRRRTERRDTASSAMAVNARTVSGAGGGGGGRNPSPVRGGRGTSPGKLPRVGSSTGIHV
jgi:hypothetical protein